jgi:hypothetical protein
MKTIEQIISGETRERCLDDARARVPMTAPEVRHCIAARIAATGETGSAVGMARAALKLGNLAPCGRDIYRRYLVAATSKP